MTYQAVRTDDGLEIRDGDGDVVAGPSSSNPIRDKDLDNLLEDAGFSEKQQMAIKIALGDVTPSDERSPPE